jgi:isoleucyl-tRNA synthetase
LLASLKKYAQFLPGLFIVSQVEVIEGDAPGATAAAGLPGLKILVARAAGSKCLRCWNFSTRVGENADFPTVCERCVAALEEIERTTGLPPVTPKS